MTDPENDGSLELVDEELCNVYAILGRAEEAAEMGHKEVCVLYLNHAKDRVRSIQTGVWRMMDEEKSADADADEGADDD